MATALKEKTKKFVEEWRGKLPKEKWQFIHDIGSTMCEAIGIRVYTNMKNDWHSYSFAAFLSVYFALVSYTIWFYFKQGEYISGLECTYSAGMVTLVSFNVTCF